MTDFADLVDEKSWAPLIGRFVIAFGRIESTAHACLRDWADPVMYPHVKSFRLKERLRLIQDLVKKSSASEQQRSEFLSCVREINALVEQRNAVVHDTLLLMVYTDPGEPVSEPAISADNKSTFITFSEMVGFTEKAERCQERLSQICTLIWANEINRDDWARLGALPPPFGQPHRG